MNIAVIFAGGVGSRMKRTGLPKQFLDLCGKPIIIHTLEKFANNNDIDAIVVACHKDYIEHLNILISRFKVHKIIKVLPGGKTGQESIFICLHYLHEILQNKKNDHDSIVLLHDGVRPFIKSETISESINITKQKGNCILASKAIETIAIVDNEQIKNIINRNQCLLLKAPQVFYFKDIYNAHLLANKEGRNDFVDSAELMLTYNTKLNYLHCEPTNIKITTPIDYFAAQGILQDEVMKHVYGI